MPTVKGLFVSFFRLCLAAFGGGFASPLRMLHEGAINMEWLDSKTFMDGISQMRLLTFLCGKD